MYNHENIYLNFKIHTYSVHNHGRMVKEAIFFKWINSKNVIVHSSLGLTGYKNKLANIDRLGFEK